MAASRVAVVGGGLAGLSAAMELKERGLEVVLFERSRLLGGKATSFFVDGVEVDNGQHVCLACCTEFVDFVRRIEPPGSSLLHLQDRFDALLLARGRRPARLRAVSLPAPWHLAPALLRYHYLTPFDRLQVGRAIFAARTPPEVGETFAAWLDHHHQSRSARRAFWDPFMVPALNAPLEVVSAEAALFTIATAFLSDAGAARFGYAQVPLAHIAAAAARSLDRVYLRTAVATLDLTDEVVSGEQGSERQTVRGVILEDGNRVPCDAVVLAVPPARLKRILGKPEALGVFGLEDFQYAPIVDVHLWYDVPGLSFGFAAVLDSPVQWVFEKAPGYLCCSMSAAHDYVSWSSADLVELCRRELADVVPELAGARLLRGAATRDREATFVPSPGLKRPGASTTCPGVAIAGAWTDTGWPATMESAVRSGRMAARLVAGQVRERKEIAIG